MKLKGQQDLKSELSSQQTKETDKAHGDAGHTDINHKTRGFVFLFFAAL